MWPAAVVVVDVDAEDVLEMSAADDQHSVEALAADGADPRHVSVCVRRLAGCANHFDARTLEKSIESMRELGVAIVEEEPHLPPTLVEIHEEVARLLQNPGGFRRAGAGDGSNSGAFSASRSLIACSRPSRARWP